MKTGNTTASGRPPQQIDGGRDLGGTIDALLDEYFGERSLWEEAFERDEALLAALLLENRGEKSVPDVATQQATDEASYDAYEVEVNAEGIIDDHQQKEGVEGAKIDLGSVHNQISLRFDNQIRVALKSPDKGDPWITYDDEESPVPGLNPETRYVWVKAGPDATANPTVQIEAGLSSASMGDGTREAQEATNDRLGNWDTLDGFYYATDSTNPESLPSHDVPDGVTTLVTYGRGNTGQVFVGSEGIQPATLSDPPNSFAAQVRDTSEIWVRTPNAGDRVGVLFEQTEGQ